MSTKQEQLTICLPVNQAWQLRPCFREKAGAFLCPKAVEGRTEPGEYRSLAHFANLAHRRKMGRFSPRDLADKQI